MKNESTKAGMHPRNRFREGYDFQALTAVSPVLKAFVKPNAYGDDSIDYANPLSVKALNQALLRQAYGLQHWDIPAGYLCPPIPGRSDYLHHLADLIEMRQGPSVRALDVGSGANCIYPLLGACEYGWSFVAAEVDEIAHRWAGKVVSANAAVSGVIECRLQKSPAHCFRGIIQPGEHFDLTMCNPPFHSSAAEAAEGTQRKRWQLGLKKAVLNFGGKSHELWCEGGELAFIRRMIDESIDFAKACRWFTTLVSKSEHLPKLQRALHQVKPTEVKIIEMAQGQKKSRILAWTFQNEKD